MIIRALAIQIPSIVIILRSCLRNEGADNDEDRAMLHVFACSFTPYTYKLDDGEGGKKKREEKKY